MKQESPSFKFMDILWKESLRHGRTYSVTLPAACSRQQGYRKMPCPSKDFFVTPKIPNQSCCNSDSFYTHFLKEM